nr:hypothetical protein Iba_scaffold14938CG0090 [Ipomoea batatas]
MGGNAEELRGRRRRGVALKETVELGKAGENAHCTVQCSDNEQWPGLAKPVGQTVQNESREWTKYLPGRGLSVCYHVCERRDDVDCEANEKCSHSGVDRPEEGEYDGQEPYRYHHGIVWKANLDNMVLEADILFFLSGSVLNIQYTDKISSPASKKAIKDLQQNP